MIGVITSKDLFLEAFTIIRLWGPRCWLRCLRAAARSSPTTFLEVACSHRQRTEALRESLSKSLDAGVFFEPIETRPDGPSMKNASRPAANG
jgi:hypothetical protein